MNIRELEDAYMIASSDPGGSTEVLICKKTGKTLVNSDYSGIYEIPEDADEDDYLMAPNKYDLDLGNKLVFDFILDTVPDEYDRVRGFFSRRGAYGKYKDFLGRKGLVDVWHEHENVKTEEALRAWAKDKGLELTD